jgi:hypothetical protein
MSLPDADVDIVIAGGRDGAPDFRCNGPNADGSCPRVAAGERVDCAGRILLAMHGVPIDGWDTRVADDATGCPLAWLLTRLLTPPSNGPAQ